MTFPLSHMVVDTRGVASPNHENRGERAPATDSPSLDDAMRAFYAEVDADIAARSPVCINRGHCCKFAEYGHRLYVTDVELAYFVASMKDQWRAPDDSGACPYQLEGRCNARERRPLGCRVFFCDPASSDWQGPMYERYLGELKAMGDRFGIPYQYREWLSALKSAS